jgi:hypothetical protein
MRVSYKKQKLLSFMRIWVHSGFFFVRLLIFLVICVVLLCVFTFGICCDFRIKGSSLSLVVCKRLCWFYYSGASSYWPSTYFICFVLYEEFEDDQRVIRIRKSLFHYQDFYQTWLYIWVTRMSYEKQSTHGLHHGSRPYFPFHIQTTPHREGPFSPPPGNALSSSEGFGTWESLPMPSSWIDVYLSTGKTQTGNLFSYWIKMKWD